MNKFHSSHHHKPDLLLVLVCIVGFALSVTLVFHHEQVQQQQIGGLERPSSTYAFFSSPANRH